MNALRLAFMGSPDLGLPCLEALAAAPDMDLVQVVTLGDARRGRRGQPEPTPVGRAALEAGLPLLRWEKGERRAVEATLAALNLDAIVVIAFARILRPSLLALPRLGCLNLHASLLPWGRGASPIQQAILDGLETTGWSAMLMDEGLDTGPVLDRQALAIAAGWTSGELYGALQACAPPFLLRVLREWSAGRLRPEAQSDAAASYAPRIRAEAGALDWERAAAELERRIRAHHPWPGSWFRRDDRRVRVHGARLVPGQIEAQPGEVLEAGPRLRVACASEGLEILRLQAPGGRPMSAADYLNGHPLAVGDRLGNG